MQYSILKTIIETSLGQFACQHCQKKLDIEHLTIQTISDQSVDFDLTCPNCQTHTLMHAEVGGQWKPGHLPHVHHQTETTTMITKNENAIKEQDITIIEQTLKDHTSIEDLLR